MGERPPVNFLFFQAQIVLLKEIGKPLVESRVVGVMIDFAPQHAKRLRNLFKLHQSGQIALEDS